MPAFWLSIHADYACRHSGACCTSHWPIPVEAPVAATLAAALASGHLRAVARGGPPLLDAPAGAPPETSGILAVTARGHCVFHDESARGGRCEIHRVLGPAALPSSCRHFPRVCLIDPRGTFVTLSHYCPTAAALLFRDDRPLAIVEGPDPVRGAAPEGLDARRALPPMLTPRVLCDHEGYDAWERFVVSAMADDTCTPEQSLAACAAGAEALRAWRPGGATLAQTVRALTPESVSLRTSRRDTLFEEVRGCLPSGISWPEATADLDRVWERLIVPVWPAFSRPLRRYLAAKGFASWVAYQGEGLRSHVRSLEAALAVVAVEAARVCAADTRPLDATRLARAIRQADLLLVHLAGRDELAKAWSRAERA